MGTAAGSAPAKRPPGDGEGIDAWIAAWREASPEARGGICMECRAVLAEGASCHGRPATTWARWIGLRSRVVERARRPAPGSELSNEQRKTRLIPWVFGAIGFFSLGVVIDGDPSGVVGVILGVGGAVVSRILIGRDEPRRPAAAGPVPEPGGVASDAGLPETDVDRPPLHGRLTGGEDALAVEERIVLDDEDADVVFARFGRTTGGTVTLDDGRVVHLPPGRLRVVDEGGHTRTVASADREGTRLDRTEAHVGDHVTLVATLVPEAPASRGYRDPPPATLRAVGEIMLGLHAAGPQ